jgi:transposase
MSKTGIYPLHDQIVRSDIFMNAVGIDVSKGKSMVAIMRPFGKVVASPFEIKHTTSDVSALIDFIQSIEGESRIVMEHTGRYYEVLAHQLSEAGFFVSAVNPKLIKDFENDSLRKVKSDKADAAKIARYALDKWTKLKQYSVMDELRNQLKTMNRQFGFYMKHKTAMKNNLIGILDQTYPGVNTYFDSPARSDGSQKWVDFAATYWHVDCVRKMSLNAFTDHYQKWCKRKKYNFSKNKAEEIYGKAKELVPVLPKDEVTKLIIRQAIDQLNSASTTIEELRTLMNETASKLPEYPVVMQMKGVGPSLGPQLMAEIGDVTRFTHKGAITAFAGVDPGVNESGSYEQKSVPVSKRGSAELRKTLFQVMDVLIKAQPSDDPVYKFLDKKRAQGKPYYVYMTAGANKFLRIYYGRVKEYLLSLPEFE